MTQISSAKFISECGFHDNIITSIHFTEYDTVINIDDMYANMRSGDGNKTPGKIVVKKCVKFSCDYLTSNWITDGSINNTSDGQMLTLTLNTGAKLAFHGINIEIYDDKDNV